MKKKRVAKRFELVSTKERNEIYNLWRTGLYYQKELCSKYKITTFTLYKIIDQAQSCLKGEQ